MFKTLRELFQLIIAKIQIHKARNEGQLRHKAITNVIEGHIEILQAIETSFLKVDLFDLIMRYIDLFYSW